MKEDFSEREYPSQKFLPTESGGFRAVPNPFPPLRKVYLAGPITGLSYDDARFGWRGKFVSLMPDNILCYSPMRGKDNLAGLKKIGAKAEEYTKHPITSGSGIVCRDSNDVMTCDAMVANFLGAEKASLGTAWEFGIAFATRKPIVMIMEADGSNVHNHLLLTGTAGYITDNLEDAAFLIKHLLLPGV